MKTPRRRRTTLAAVTSVLVHLAVLATVLLQRPNALLVIGQTAPAPDHAIQVVLVSRNIPRSARHAPSPSVMPLHRPLTAAPEAPTAPIAPPAPQSPATARGPVALQSPPIPEAPKEDLRTALRQGAVGCANRQIARLSRTEREHCDEILGRGAKDTAFAGLGLSPDKRRLLEAAGAHKEREYRYLHAQMPGAVPDTAARPGETAEDMKRSLGVSGHTAAIPF